MSSKKPVTADQQPTRRSLLKGAAAVLGSAASTPLLAAASPKSSPPFASIGPAVTASANTAVVSTTAGRIAGYVRKNIYTFKGIPYGDTTEGENRFMPPAKPKPWTDIRSCRQYGAPSPQITRTGDVHNDEEAFMFNWDDGMRRVYRQGESEDCLRLNVWTPALDTRKRPVMVWLHGGGFAAGSSHEQPGYDGENLCRRGDVVVVSINHRLNILGFVDLSNYGEKYKSASMAGMLDIVASLEWVRDNIAAFGGDPGNVTIFGQSGGGGKVSLLMAMPYAQGLFHRAIVESGSTLRVGLPEPAQHLADLFVAQLGLNKETIDRIQTIPFADLLKASEDVMHKLNPPEPPARFPNARSRTPRQGFGPIVDGSILPAQPFDPNAPEISASVPMMMGTTLNEFMHGMNHPEYEAMTDAELEEKVHGVYGDKASAVLAAFRKRTPNAKPFDLWSHIAAAPVRQNAIRQATAKAALGKAPAYLYWFTWQTPILEGRPRAFHCAEIAFVFDNTDLCDTMTGGGEDARVLAAKVSDAWIHFARTGDPNHPGIPHWAPFSPDTMATMIFDNKTVAINGPDREEQQTIAMA